MDPQRDLLNQPQPDNLSNPTNPPPGSNPTNPTPGSPGSNLINFPSSFEFVTINIGEGFNPMYPSPGFNPIAGSGGSSGGSPVEPEKKRGGTSSSSPNDSLRLGPSSAESPPSKKPRGRPLGSKNKPKDALGSLVVDASTVRLITVNAEEGVISALVSFSRQQQPGITVFVLSANGYLRSGTLGQGRRTFEGPFPILSFNGILLFSETANTVTGNLSVSLEGSDGKVLGGTVNGPLTAASPVTIAVVTFDADEKGSKSESLTPPSNKSKLGAK